MLVKFKDAIVLYEDVYFIKDIIFILFLFFLGLCICFVFYLLIMFVFVVSGMVLGLFGVNIIKVRLRYR